MPWPCIRYEFSCHRLSLLLMFYVDDPAANFGSIDTLQGGLGFLCRSEGHKTEAAIVATPFITLVADQVSTRDGTIFAKSFDDGCLINSKGKVAAEKRILDDRCGGRLA